jgi:hypothetical protein
LFHFGGQWGPVVEVYTYNKLETPR